MGDTTANRNDPTALRREADELRAAAAEKQAEADRLELQKRGRYRRRRVDSLGRRWYDHLMVVKVVLLGLVIWAWESARRPVLASAVGAAGIVAVPVALDTPLPPAQSQPPRILDFGGETRPPQEPGDGDTYNYITVLPPAVPEPAVVEPEPPPVEIPEPTPVPTITLTPTPEPTVPVPEPTVGIDVELDPLEVCAELGLPDTMSLDACLQQLDRLDVDVDLLGVELDLGLGLLGR